VGNSLIVQLSGGLMIKLILAGLVLASLGYLILTLYKKMSLIEKEQELERVDIEGEIIDLELDIAEEKRRQRKVKDDINNLNS
jgi:hypothetical protein